MTTTDRKAAQLAALDAQCKSAHAQLVAEDAARVEDNRRYRVSAPPRDLGPSTATTTRP